MKNWFSGICWAISAAACLFVVSFIASTGFGTNAQSGCVVAILLSVIAAFVGICDLIKAKERQAEFVNSAIWVGSWARLRTTGIGIFIASLIIEEEIGWFLGWTGFFYVTLLTIQVIFIVWFFNVYDWKRYDYFDDDTSEFVVGDDISS